MAHGPLMTTALAVGLLELAALGKAAARNVAEAPTAQQAPPAQQAAQDAAGAPPPVDEGTRRKIEQAQTAQQQVEPASAADQASDRPEPVHEFFEAPMLFMERPYFALGPLRYPRYLIAPEAGGTALVFEVAPRKAFGFQQHIQRADQVRRGVDEGAVQVEGDRGPVEGTPSRH